MADTLFRRTRRDDLPDRFKSAWDTLHALTGEPDGSSRSSGRSAPEARGLRHGASST